MITTTMSKKIEYSFDNKSGFKGTCIVIHTPTKSNFWHFSLRWQNNNGEDVSSVNTHKRAVLSAAKNFIKICGKPNFQAFSILPEYHYTISDK
ncbi:MAG: hypothetical protein ACLQQ4_07575 [Bacteroidia bacterium]